MVLFVLGRIYGYKGAIIIIEVCVCVLRTLIKLSGCVEKTVLMGGSVRADSVHFLCIACVYTNIIIIVQFFGK